MSVVMLICFRDQFARFREPRRSGSLQRAAGRSGSPYPGPNHPPRHGSGLGRFTSLAAELRQGHRRPVRLLGRPAP